MVFQEIVNDFFAANAAQPHMSL